MTTRRMKLDYNHLMQQIVDFLNENNTEENERFVFGLGIGLELLEAYMKNIAERVIELNDEVLIGLLKDLCILVENEQNDGTPKERGADKPKTTCLNCKHLMFSDMYGECNKQLKIVNPSDTCEYAEPKERGVDK